MASATSPSLPNRSGSARCRGRNDTARGDWPSRGPSGGFAGRSASRPGLVVCPALDEGRGVLVEYLGDARLDRRGQQSWVAAKQHVRLGPARLRYGHDIDRLTVLGCWLSCKFLPSGWVTSMKKARSR